MTKMKNYRDFSNIDKKFKKGKKIKPRKKKGKWLFYLIILFVSLAVFFGLVIPFISKLALLNIFLTLTPASNFITENNVLILGVDSNRGTHRSDTIMLAHIDPAQREAKLVSVPRDTLVVIPGRGLDKVNHAFAYGGVNLSRKTLQEFLGVPVPYYITVDIGGLANIIDKLGGVKINVEKRMYYVDYAGNLFVNLKPGLQVLNGREAVGYVRFRHDSEGDIGRIRRQQKFIKAFGAQLAKKENLLKSPGLLLSLINEIHTNMSLKQVLGLVMAVKSANDLGRIEMTSIPGKDLMIDKIYYMRPDWDQTKEIVEKFLKPRKQK